MIVIDAKIRNRGWYEPDGTLTRFECWWEGGEIAGISDEVIQWADPKYVQLEGDKLRYGDLNLIVVQHEGGIYYVRRATEADA